MLLGQLLLAAEQADKFIGVQLAQPDETRVTGERVDADEPRGPSRAGEGRQDLCELELAGEVGLEPQKDVLRRRERVIARSEVRQRAHGVVAERRAVDARSDSTQLAVVNASGNGAFDQDVVPGNDVSG